jgi:hypothetical protein
VIALSHNTRCAHLRQVLIDMSLEGLIKAIASP